MKVLIIEGPDLSGKSVAIEKIAKHFKSGFLLKNLYKPNSTNDSEIYAQYFRMFNWCLTQEFVILDRFFPSQAVYSYLRGQDEMDSWDIKTLDNFCAEREFYYIYVDTPIKELKRRYYARGDEHIKVEDLVKLKERYDRFYNNTNMKKIKIDTRKKLWLKKIEKVIKYEYQ